MNYRREIDGLRAIAVLPVIGFHAGFKAFAGGFVGVDIFFVISGYLITTIILGEKQAGQFSLLQFYERRARRILPAMLFVMLACLPFAWIWMLPEQLKEFGRNLIATSLFSSNILFWRESGYFAAAADEKPLLHTWSLAVEEQYYVLFPLFVLLIWPLGRRWLIGALIACVLASLGLAEWGARHTPTSNFFFTPARGWELLLGAIISCYRTGDGHARRSELAGLLGLALIAYAILTFGKHTPFPGRHALIPTVGTALIILYATQETIVGRILGSRWLVGLGLISYSTYLWHQPLFAFARIRSMIEPEAGIFALLGIVAVFLGYLTWHFIERPFRDRNRINSKVVVISAVTASVAMVGVGLILNHNNGFQDRFSLPASLAATFEKSKKASDCIDKSNLHSRGDWLCPLGSDTVKPSFLVFGDSHAISFFPAFDATAKRIGAAGLFASASGCAPFLSIYSLRSDQHIVNCHLLNKRVLDHAIKNGIRRVFLVARWTYYTDGGYDGNDFSFISLISNADPDKTASRRAFAKGLHNTVGAYRAAGIDLHVVAQVPQQRHQPQVIYYRSYDPDPSRFLIALRSFSVTLADHAKLQSHVSGLFFHHQMEGHLKILSFTKAFCDQSLCNVGTSANSYYYDDDHLSLAGASLVADQLQAYLHP